MQDFNSKIETQQQEILQKSLSVSNWLNLLFIFDLLVFFTVPQLIDKKNFLLNVLQKKNLHKLSSEILKVNPFA